MNSLVTFLLLVGMAILVYNLNKLTSLVNQNNEDLRSKIILIQRNIMSLQETKECYWARFKQIRYALGNRCFSWCANSQW